MNENKRSPPSSLIHFASSSFAEKGKQNKRNSHRVQSLRLVSFFSGSGCLFHVSRCRFSLSSSCPPPHLSLWTIWTEAFHEFKWKLWVHTYIHFDFTLAFSTELLLLAGTSQKVFLLGKLPNHAFPWLLNCVCLSYHIIEFVPRADQSSFPQFVWKFVMCGVTDGRKRGKFAKNVRRKCVERFMGQFISHLRLRRLYLTWVVDFDENQYPFSRTMRPRG